MRQYIEYSIDDINEEFNIHWDALFWKYLFKRMDFGAGISLDFNSSLLLADATLFDDVSFIAKLNTVIEKIQEKEIDKKFYEKFQ